MISVINILKEVRNYELVNNERVRTQSTKF